MKYIRYGELSNMLPPYFHGRENSSCNGTFPAAGRIAGKFKNGFHIEFSGSQGEEEIFPLHIGSLSRPLCAFGISINDEFLQNMLSLCQEGDLVYGKLGKLFVYGWGEQFCLDWQADGFSVKDMAIPRLEDEEIEKTQDGVYRLLKAEIENGEWESHMGLSWDEDFLRCASLLSQGGQGEEEEKKRLLEAAGFFCGRGLGLTPSGDDLLLGYEAVLLAAKKPLGEFLASYMAEHALARTTAVSSAYYQAASLGYVNEDFKNFLLCAFGKGRLEEKETIDKVKCLGHTSGHDTLFGAYLGLKRLEQDEEG